MVDQTFLKYCVWIYCLDIEQIFIYNFISSIVSKMRCLSVKVHVLYNYYVYQALII